MTWVILSSTLKAKMEPDITAKNYELAYHLNPDIEESELGAHVQELQNIITQNSGSILVSKDPKRKHLSYPIKHKHYSHFGIFDFSATPETLEKLNAQLKLQNDILRYILLKKEIEDKDLRILGVERHPRIKTHEPTALSREEMERAGKEEVKPEEMEKEIEEVLEKI